MATKNIFLNYEWPIGLFELKCSGNETTIWDCTYNTSHGGQYCYQRNDASVFCMRELYNFWQVKVFYLMLIANTIVYSNCSNGDIRLVGGSTDNEGNVQICYNNAWGSVCDDSWGRTDSNVICRQLGFQPYGMYIILKHLYPLCFLLNEGSQYYRYNYFGVSNNPPYLYGRFYCSGSEQSLLSCPRSSYSYLLYCGNSEIAGVHCVGK